MSSMAEDDLATGDDDDALMAANGDDDDEAHARMTSSSGTEDLAENMFEMDIDEATSDDSSRARSVGQDSGYYGSMPKTSNVAQPTQPVMGFFAKSRNVAA